MAMLFAGLVLLALALPPFFDFPRLGFWLVPVAATYLFLLLLLPRLWLIVLPLATVGLDITPLTGRAAYTELDLLFIVTLASGLLYNRYRFKVFSPGPASYVLCCYLAVLALGYSGWFFFAQPPRAHIGNPYYTGEQAYRVLKGTLWGVALVPMWGALLAVDKRRAVNALVSGMCAAALLLGLIALWENGTLGAVFSGLDWSRAQSWLPDPGSPYRVTGVFSDMHKGGEAFDGVVLLLLPVALYAATYGRTHFHRILGVAAVLALVYLALVGFSRTAAYAAFFLSLIAYALLTLWSRRRNRLSLRLPPLGFCTLLVAAILLAVVPVRMTGRASPTEGDFGAPVAQLQEVMDSSAGGFYHALLGNGVGTFPASSIRRYPEKLRQLGGFDVARKGSRNVLLLGGSPGLTLGQRVPVEPFTDYTLNVHLRAESPARLVVGLCERNVAYARHSAPDCLAHSLPLQATDGAIEHYTLQLNSQHIGEGGIVSRWPTLLTLQYEGAETPVEIDAVDLSADDTRLLRNGSFREGLDYWFFYSDVIHRPWHAGNSYLQLWFESGWLGLGLFLALVSLLLYANIERHAPDSLLPVYTTAVFCLGLFGLFGTPLDSARVSWLFYFFLAAGLARLRVGDKSGAMVTAAGMHQSGGISRQSEAPGSRSRRRIAADPRSPPRPGAGRRSPAR